MVVGAQAKSNFVGVIILLLESFNTKNSKNQSHITLLQKVRATRGLVLTSQLPWWCSKELERTFLEQKGQNETQIMRGKA